MAGEPWRLIRFEERLDWWIEQESPPDDTRLIVTSWILSRIEDPFQGARREPDLPNLWSAVIPGSIHAPQSVVLCSYWVDYEDRRVTCDLFGTLSYPA